MNIEKLFEIADAAKCVGDYGIANSCFAAIAMAAIHEQRFGACVDEATDASRVAFLYESDHDDLISALSDPDGAGYYDLPALSLHGRQLMGGGRASHYLCIPLPLVSRWFLNHMVRLIPGDTPFIASWVERKQHGRRYWRMSDERREAARRDLRRRLSEAVSQEFLETAVATILWFPPEPEPEPEPEPSEFDKMFQAEILAKLTKIREGGAA